MGWKKAHPPHQQWLFPPVMAVQLSSREEMGKAFLLSWGKGATAANVDCLCLWTLRWCGGTAVTQGVSSIIQACGFHWSLGRERGGEAIGSISSPHKKGPLASALSWGKGAERQMAMPNSTPFPVETFIPNAFHSYYPHSPINPGMMIPLYTHSSNQELQQCSFIISTLEKLSNSN